MLDRSIRSLEAVSKFRETERFAKPRQRFADVVVKQVGV
jgi:hypothetical protein